MGEKVEKDEIKYGIGIIRDVSEGEQR